METISNFIYDFVINTLFGAVADNVWITENLDKIQGIITLVLVSIVLLIAIALVWGLWKAFGRIFTFWD